MSEQQQRGQRSSGGAAVASAIDPHEDGAGYLKARGWKCLGNPSWQSAGWLDPAKPTIGRWREIEVFAPDVHGQLQRVMADDGTGRIRPVTQRCYDPPAQPISMQDAIMLQLERDARAAAANN